MGREERTERDETKSSISPYCRPEKISEHEHCLDRGLWFPTDKVGGGESNCRAAAMGSETRSKQEKRKPSAPASDSNGKDKKLVVDLIVACK